MLDGVNSTDWDRYIKIYSVRCHLYSVSLSIIIQYNVQIFKSYAFYKYVMIK